MIKIVESLFIAIAVCIDSFAVGLSYGIKNITISKVSIIIISFVTVCALSVSMIVGNILEKIISNNLTAIFSFLIFIGLGSSIIIEGYIKHLVIKKKKERRERELANFKFSNLGIEINIIAAEEATDINVSQSINSNEAIYLGFALSLDSLGVGFGSALGNMNYMQIIAFAFVINMISIPLGLAIGRKFTLNNKNIKSYWISGGILIALGISKLT